MIKAIIFDCFGVIISDSFSTSYQAMGGDMEADTALITNTFHAYNHGVITMAELDKTMAERLGVNTRQWRESRTNAENIDRQLLAYVQEIKKTYKTALLTNAGKGSLQRRFSGEELDNHFDELIVSSEVGMAKPYTEIYELTAMRLGVEPEECIFIDDRELYCEGAEITGMQTILYKNFNQMKAELEVLLKNP